MKCIGIDIGSLSVKVAEIESTGSSYILRDFVELGLSVEPGQDHRIEIVDHLRKIASHYMGHSARYILSLPQMNLTVRNLNFPFKQRSNVLRSLAAELEDEIPLNQDHAIFEAKITRTHGNNSEVLAIVASKNNIEDLLKIAYEAGIDPDIISVDAIAQANLFEGWQLPPREIRGPSERDEIPAETSVDAEEHSSSSYAFEVVANIGHTQTLISVFYRGTLLTVRSLSRGGHDAVEALRRAYELPYNEALKGLQEKGFVLTNLQGASKDQADFSNIIVGALKPLADEIKLTLLEIRSEFGLNFQHVLLTGGMSQLMNVAAYFTQELELPCNILEVPDRIPALGVNVTPSIVSRFLVAVGLAIEGLRRPRNPAVNLRREDFGKESQYLKNFVKRWGSTFKVAGLVLVLFYIFGFVRDNFADSLEQIGQTALSDTVKASFGLKGREATEPKVRKLLSEKRHEIDARKEIAELQNLNSVLDVVGLMSQRFPGKNQLPLDIRRFLLKNENLTIEGEVSTQAQAQMVKAALQSVASDHQIREMTPSGQPTNGRLAFAYRLRVGRR